MKNMIGLALASMWLVGAAGVYAHCGKCPGDKPAAATEQKAACPAMGGLKLTDEQQQKVAALMAECGKATCTSECKTKCEAGMEKILTAEQFQTWKETCAKTAKAGQCPAAPTKTEDKKPAEKCCSGH